MGKYSLITIAGFILSFTIMRGNINQTGNDLAATFFSHYEAANARTSANSSAYMTLAKLAEEINWRTGYTSVSIGAGQSWTTLSDSGSDTTLRVDQVRILSRGVSGATSDTVIVLATVPFMPGSVRGAITANSVVTTLGNLTVDARDHDLSGTLIPGAGTLGISTTQTVNQGGGSDIGGTNSGTDYPPTKPANPVVLEENAAYTFPTTPDEVLGWADENRGFEDVFSPC